MEYTIYRNTAIIAKVFPTGKITHKIMGEELVTMNFKLTTKVDFKINDKVLVYGNTYYLLTEPTVIEVNSKQFDYSLQFAGIKYELSKVQYFFPDALNNLTVPEFDITGTAQQMLALIVQNANRVQSGWSLGVVDNLNGKQLNFNGDNCLTALAKISEEFEVEYWVDGNKSIHLTERKYASGYTLSYGQNKGLRSLTQTPIDSNIVTRVYAVGSDKNIPANYRNYSKHLKMQVPYLEKNTAKYGVIEHTEIFEDVFPHREGTVTAIDPNNFLSFSDASLDFDLNETDANGTTILINNVSAKVTFNTGQLAGYEFEIKENGFDSATKTFELLPNTDEKNLKVPSSIIHPEVGDKYVITDIKMPASYIANAETKLKAKAQLYLDENCEQRFVYKTETDPIYFKNNNVNIELGATVLLKSIPFNLNENLRVVSIVKDLQNSYKVDLELAERASLVQIVRDYIKNEKEQLKIYKQYTNNAEMARRSYNFAKEFHNKVFDGEGYFEAENIKPLSIETKMLSVGSKMQQFSLPDIAFVIEDSTTIYHTTGRLVHLTLEENIREWQIAQNTILNLVTDFNYIYVKAQKIGTNASIKITPNKILVDEDANYYHFEVGYLSQVINDIRRIKTTYGFTQITPSEITTGRIASGNGQQYIDLLDDKIVINADVRFSNDNIKQVANSIDIGSNNLLVNSELIPKPVGVANKLIYTGIERGVTYTIKGKYHMNLGGIDPVVVVYESGTTPRQVVPLILTSVGVDGSFEATFTSNVDGDKLFLYAKENYNDSSIVDVDFKKVMLVIGNKIVTTWSESTTDLKNKSNAYTDDQINTIDIGSVNLANNSKYIYKPIGVGNIELYNKIEQGKTYMIRGNYHLISGGLKITLIILKSGGVSQRLTPNIVTGGLNGKFELTFTSTVTSNRLILFANVDNASSKTINVNFSEIMLVEGNRMVNNWQPSPADVEQELTNVKDITAKLEEKTDFVSETKINGNTVATGVLQVGNSQGANAGISGAGINGVRFYAGSTFSDRNSAPFRVLDNGSFYALNAVIKGFIEAKSGKIAGFDITSSGLETSYDNGYDTYKTKITPSSIEINNRVGVGLESNWDLSGLMGFTEKKIKITANSIVLRDMGFMGVNEVSKVEITANGIKINGRDL